MALDYFAIATQGFFPTPTPTAAVRMARAASWGYLEVAGPPSVTDTLVKLNEVILNEVLMNPVILNDTIIM